MTAAVSVIMSVFNDGAYLEQAVRSILAQTMPAFEFLIVDDGSSDDSPRILTALAEQDSRIVLLRQANKGLPASLNILIDKARAPLLARMDGDDVALPDRLERQLAFMRAHPDYGVVGTQVAAIDTAGRPLPRMDVTYPVTHDELIAAAQISSPLCHPSVMMRRDLIRAVGGYRSAYRHCEDYDLWLRLIEVTRLGSLPDRLLQYRRSSNQVSNRHRLEQLHGAYVAQLAYQLRSEGCPDPTDGLAVLPYGDALDALFPGKNAAQGARARIAADIRYDPVALAGDGLPIMLAYLGDTANDRAQRISGLWRAALRMVRTGYVSAPMRLGLALLRP